MVAWPLESVVACPWLLFWWLTCSGRWLKAAFTIMIRGRGGRRAMQKQAAGEGGPLPSPTPPPGRPHRSGLVRLIPVLVRIMVLTILAVGLMLYRHVHAPDHELDSAITELRAPRGQQAHAEHRIGDLADEVRDAPSWSVSACGRRSDLSGRREEL
jgi:hypothetical protein